MSFIFQPRGSHRPKTAAERQRECRARGKGRHRGFRPTRAHLAVIRRHAAEQLAALEAAQGHPPTPQQVSAATLAAFAAVRAGAVAAPVTPPTPAPPAQPAQPATRTMTWREGAD